MRTTYEDQARKEVRKKRTVRIKTEASSTLKPWRDVIAPHPDVAAGRYSQAEFAADLWEVYRGRGTTEYSDPVEFFRRTYITEGLSTLLKTALSRLSGKGGDPVIELQTNFGGGKTHTMLALFHLFSGSNATDLAGIEQLIADEELSIPKYVKRAIIYQSGRCSHRPLQKILSMYHPDRRVGCLCPSLIHLRRSSVRYLRHPVHLHSNTFGVGEERGELSTRGEYPRVGE